MMKMLDRPSIRRRLGALLAPAIALVLIAAAAPAIASAASPGWRILGVTSPTNLPLTQDETQQVAVAAYSGTYTLTFEGQTTSPIASNAQPGDVASALDALSTIGGAGGSADVSGGPGSNRGDSPYSVTFGGSLADTDVPQMTADGSLLTTPFGTPTFAHVSTSIPGGHNGSSTMVIHAINVGGANSAGTKTVDVTLPAGITTSDTPSGTGWTCTPSGAGQVSFTCTSSTAVDPGLLANPIIAPIVRSGSTPGTSVAHLSISGGGASGTATYDEPIVSSSKPATAGVQAFLAGAHDANGDDETQAGAHPYSATTMFLVNTVLAPSGTVVPAGDPRDIKVDLPPGFVGNPLVTPRCPVPSGTLECSTDTIIGVAGSFLGDYTTDEVQGNALYNDTPPPGSPAEFAFLQGTTVAALVASVRTGGDYGVTITSPNTLQAPFKVFGAYVTIWGTPADSVHDSQRCGGISLVLCAFFPTSSHAVPVRPLLTNPTDCAGEAVSPPTTVLHLNSWQDPLAFDSMDAVSPPVTGCDKLTFAPTVSLQPDSKVADAPTGLSVGIHVPQTDSPSTLATPELKDTTVTLPAGMTVSSAAADGLAGCSPAQIALHSAGPADCPDASKIGTVEIDSPLVDHPLRGGVYLAQQNANPFNSLLAIYIAIDDKKTGVVVKLAGHVVPDPHTGQLVTTFDNNPQLPFSDFKLHFNGGPRASLVNPSTCGVKTSTARLSSYAGQVVNLHDSFSVNQGCDAGKGFDPDLSAGLVNASAGGSSPFTLTVSRNQGENLTGMDVRLPRGLLAALKGVALCPDNAAATGACPAASKIGHVTVAAGAGSHPLYVPQAGKAPTAVYLAGPYKGGPYSLVIKVPAQAGPFDLGTVAVRAALYVDPETAQVTVKSDPMPQILQGIPLEYRKVNVVVDRNDFMRSPTNCRPMRVHADVHGAPLNGPVKVTPSGLGIAAAADAVAHLADRFQVGSCGSLPFKPRMGMRLRGKHQRRDGGHPALITNVREPEHQANIRKVRVALPLSLALDPKNSQHVCDYDKAKAVHGTKAPCSKRTIVGRAVAKTPLLPHKLRAHVYLVQGIRFNKEGQRIKTLPTLLVPLRGKDHVAVDLRAKTNVSHKKLVTTFRNVPDAQISSFKLKINGGKRGILVVTHNQNICRGSQVTDTTYRGQSGARYSTRVHMKAPCKGIKKHRRIHHLRRAAHKAARHGNTTKARKALRHIHRIRHAN